jgi:hypothetical protein
VNQSLAGTTVAAHRAAALVELDHHNTAEIGRFTVRCGVVR